MKYRLAVIFPLAIVALVTVCVASGRIAPDGGTFLFWGLAFLVGLVFLIQYSLRTHWWRKHTDPRAKTLAQFQREVIVWTSLITFSAGLAVATVIWGLAWVPRPAVRYVLAAASFLALFRRYALYLRTRRGRRPDLAQAVTDAVHPDRALQEEDR